MMPSLTTAYLPSRRSARASGQRVFASVVEPVPAVSESPNATSAAVARASPRTSTAVR